MIPDLVDALLGNALVASVLGACAWIASRDLRRPALAHGLYLLALIKLITPPIVALPLGWLPAAEPQRPPAPVAAPVGIIADAPASPAVALRPRGEATLASSTGGATPAPPPTAGGRGAGDGGGWSWIPLGWAVGTLWVASVLARRGIAFHRATRRARPASVELADEVGRLAARIGLRRCPAVATIAARIPPLVHPTRRGPAILLPTALLSSLTREQRATLLLHELAHVRRGDHWVRGLEVAVALAFWWLPLTWWLRAGLREAEERCCDAWVTAAAPNARRAYCDALLAVVDSLSGARVSAPAHTSAITAFRSMQRRLATIMITTTRRRLGFDGRLAVGLATAAVALSPVFGQTPDANATERVEQKLDTLELSTRFERAAVRQWMKRLSQDSGLVFVAADGLATARDPARTTLRDLALPELPLRRVLDVIASVTDTTWRVRSDGAIEFDAPAAAGGKIYVFGATNAMGEHPLGEGSTILEVLSRIGVSKATDLGRVSLIRSDPGNPLTVEVDVRAMVESGNTTHNLQLRDGDLLVLHARSGAGARTPPEHLQVGDRLRFVVDPAAFRAPGSELLAMLNEQQSVDAKGRVLVPYVGRVRVVGMTEDEVETLVTESLGELFRAKVTLYARFAPRSDGPAK